MILPALGLVLLVFTGVGLIRLFMGPTEVDRMLVAQLLSTVGVGLILVLGGAGADPGSRVVALVVALLAAVAGVAFVRRYLPHNGGEGDGDG